MDSILKNTVDVANGTKGENVRALSAVRDLGDHALSTVLQLVGVEKLFLQNLSELEISGLCCIFPKVRDWFLKTNSMIGALPKTLDVANLFQFVPSASALQPLLECFDPQTVVVRLEKAEAVPYDILLAFDPLRPFYSLEVILGRHDIVLLRGRYHVRKLSILQNKWDPAHAAVHTILSGVTMVKEVVLTHGQFDVVMAAYLEHQRFTHLELRDVGFPQIEISQLVSWLVSRRALTHLSIIDYPYWVSNTNEVRFYRLLISRIAELRDLRYFEFSIGGTFFSLHALLRMRELRKMRVNIEIHLSYRLQAHLLEILHSFRHKTVIIGFYCGRDWSCVRRQASGRNFVKWIKKKFPEFVYLSCRDDLELI